MGQSCWSASPCNLAAFVRLAHISSSHLAVTAAPLQTVAATLAFVAEQNAGADCLPCIRLLSGAVGAVRGLCGGCEGPRMGLLMTMVCFINSWWHLPGAHLSVGLLGTPQESSMAAASSPFHWRSRGTALAKQSTTICLHRLSCARF